MSDITTNFVNFLLGKTKVYQTWTYMGLLQNKVLPSLKTHVKSSQTKIQLLLAEGGDRSDFDALCELSRLFQLQNGESGRRD